MVSLSIDGTRPRPEKVTSWTYQDQLGGDSRPKSYFVKDLPAGGQRYFAYPLWLMSDKPSFDTNPIISKYNGLSNNQF